MSDIIHHPSCAARHGEGPCNWYCGVPARELADPQSAARGPHGLRFSKLDANTEREAIRVACCCGWELTSSSADTAHQAADAHLAADPARQP